MNNYISLGNKYLKVKKLRSAVVISSMMLASTLLYLCITAVIGTFMHERKAEEGLENYHVDSDTVTKEQYQFIQQYANVESAVQAAEFQDVIIEGIYGYGIYSLRMLDKTEQDIFPYRMTEGRPPENSDEIMLHREMLKKARKQVGNKIFVCIKRQNDEWEEESIYTGREYTISGAYDNVTLEAQESSYGQTAYTLADADTALTTYVRFQRKYHWKQDGKQLAEALSEVDKAAPRMVFHLNSSLGEYYFQSIEMIIYAVYILMVAVFVIYFCMVMIRSLMSTNVIDKVQDYMILKSIGATNRQLRRIFMRECLWQGIIAYIGGIIFGNLLSHLVLVRVFGSYIAATPYIGLALAANALFLWGTIELASIEPFARIRRLSIVAALANADIIKKPKKKKGSQRRLYKRLPIELQYAWKNVSRSRKGFWNAVASFTMSIIVLTMMIVVPYIQDGGYVIQSELFSWNGDNVYDIWLDLAVRNNFEMHADGSVTVSQQNLTVEEMKQAEQELEKNPMVTELYTDIHMDLALNPADGQLNLTPEAASETGGEAAEEFAALTIYLLKDAQLARLNDYMETEGDAAELLKNGGVLVQNRAVSASGADYHLFPVKAGAEISVEALSFVRDFQESGDTRYHVWVAKEENAYENVEVKGLLRVNPWCRYSQRAAVMSYDYVRDAYGEDFVNAYVSFLYGCIDRRRFTEAGFDAAVGDSPYFTGWNYVDIKKQSGRYVEPITYVLGVAGVFLIILGIINILNTIVNEQLQRKKENAILRALGMSAKSMNRMLIAEKLVIGVISCVVGTILAYVLCYVYLAPQLELNDMAGRFPFPWHVSLVIALAVLAVTGVFAWAMVLLSGKLNITEGIRNQE